MRALDPKPDLAEETLASLRDAILDGELAPNAPLAQEAIAARLGVSRQPVSQALMILKRDGLVVERGRRGLAVAPFEPERVRNLYQVRGALDGLAAGLAAGLATARDAERLEPTLAAGEAALARDDVSAMIAADVAFHADVYALAGNPEIGVAAETLWPHFRRAMSAVLRAQGHGVGLRAQSWREHRAIVAAIVAGDAAEAERLAREHCLASGAAAAERLARLSEETKP